MLQQYLPYLVPLLVIALLAARMSRSMQGRPIKPSRLWIRPIFIAVFMGLTLAVSPAPGPLGLALFGLAVVLGLGFGYLLAHHQAFTLDPATGVITSKTSPLGMVLFVGVFGGRYVFNTMMRSGQAPGKLAAHSGQVLLYSEVALVFLLAMVGAQAWEIWRRTRPLVAEHAALAATSQAAE
jgi:hypothetical protein